MTSPAPSQPSERDPGAPPGVDAAGALSQATVDAAETCAREYLARRAAGEALDLASYVAHLEQPELRSRVLDLVRGAELVDRVVAERDEHYERGHSGELLLGRYRLVQPIGSGGMGTVWRATDERLAKDVAVKVVDARATSDWARFLEHESRVLARLDHPGIVTVQDSGVDGDRRVLVMRLVAGRSLADALARAAGAPSLAAPGVSAGTGAARKVGPRAWLHPSILPAPSGRENLLASRDGYLVAARLALEIARGLEAAHACGIVHRDLKPANVMLEPGGHPVLLDFGLAASASLADGDDAGRLVGTLPYLAPEQIRAGASGRDPRTDVYQLGLLLYELLTGERAFPGTDPSALRVAIAKGELVRPRALDPEIPSALERICLSALALDPDRRPKTPGEVRAELARFVARRGTLARTRRLWLVLPLAALVALALGWWLRPTPPARSGTSFVAYRTPPHGESQRLDPGERVHVGDFITVRVPSPRESCLYAASIFTDAEGVRRIKAIEFDYELMQLPRAQRYGMSIPACPDSNDCCDVGCILVEDVQHRMEELLLLVSEEPRNDIDAWLGSIEHHALSAGEPARYPTCDEAASLYHGDEPTRGGNASIDKLTHAQRRSVKHGPEPASSGLELVREQLEGTGVLVEHLAWSVDP